MAAAGRSFQTLQRVPGLSHWFKIPDLSLSLRQCPICLSTVSRTLELSEIDQVPSIFSTKPSHERGIYSPLQKFFSRMLNSYCQHRACFLPLKTYNWHLIKTPVTKKVFLFSFCETENICSLNETYLPACVSARCTLPSPGLRSGTLPLRPPWRWRGPQCVFS